MFLCFPWKFVWMSQDHCHVVPQLISQLFFCPSFFNHTLVFHDLEALLDNALRTLNNHSFPCAYVRSTQIIFPLYVMRNNSVLFVPEILVIPHGYGIHKLALKKENVWWKKNLRHHICISASFEVTESIHTDCLSFVKGMNKSDKASSSLQHVLFDFARAAVLQSCKSYQGV